ncbi:hypothetical protein V9T40_012193 [Parthenolecanium corni]|uniref:Uncharacterized protein n=1 Tax=Parthenolecanium corni TaxID=536013 RepID=A0AAN9TJZ2_9HEMI
MVLPEEATIQISARSVHFEISASFRRLSRFSFRCNVFNSLLKRRNNAEISDYTYRAEAEIHVAASSAKTIVSREMIKNKRNLDHPLPVAQVMVLPEEATIQISARSVHFEISASFRRLSRFSLRCKVFNLLLKRRNNAEISDYTYRADAEIHVAASSAKTIISREMMFDQKFGLFFF